MNARGFYLASAAALLVGVSPSTASIPNESVRLVQNPIEWRIFASREGRFQVMLPTPPETHTEAVNLPGQSISLHTFAANDSQSEYLITYSDYPQEFITQLGEPTQFLQSVKQGFLSGIQANEDFSMVLRLDGYPGLEVEYTTAEGTIGFARFYLVNSRLYQVIATSRGVESGSFPENADRFLTSFALQ
ncbi:MAG: hypothetical protein J7641_24365 [Cyanobacteria bacterium SID2]|nr:hypothetical protein [Cyanobacteria bacterium SID2]MBP0003236.1 hypothetical protein [Cyanobacteria bacterium SBC]